MLSLKKMQHDTINERANGTLQVQKQITDASSPNYFVSTYQSYHQTIITALQLHIVPNSYDLTQWEQNKQTKINQKPTSKQTWFHTQLKLS